MPSRAEASPAGIRSAALLGAAALLAIYSGWRLLTLGAANHVVAESPAEAQDWRQGFAEGVMLQEERRLRSPGAQPGSDDLVLTALRTQPLRPLGYRLLARHADLRGEHARTAILYGIAANRGPRDLPSVAWVAVHDLRLGNYRAALAKYDQMLRVQPELSLALNPTLMAIAADPASQEEMIRLLRRHPPWRSEFLGRFLRQAPDSRAIFSLMEGLRRPPADLERQEIDWWVARLAATRQWGPAYLTWVQSLSPEASQRIGNVYNGGFEIEPSQGGFDWRFRNVAGARISRAPILGAQGTFALRVEFEGRRVPFAHVQQLLALAPGRYRLRGRVKLDDLRSERGLVWSLRCAEGGGSIGETEPMTGRREWRDFEASFTVPERDCGGQLLVLRVPSRIPAEQRIGGVAWFDALSIKSD